MFSRSYSMSAARLAKAAIRIPKRIERGPTDILKALASTVKHVPSEPDQLLHDDPYLLPIRSTDRMLYSLSRLSGKNTAKFVLNKCPEAFYRDDAEPKVRSFMPDEVFTQEMDFTEDDIKWCIDNNDPINGVVAYKSLEKNNVKLSDETLLNFFEMICYTNEEKVSDILDFQRNCFAVGERRLVKQTWTNTNLASKLFKQIKEDFDPPRVYSAMISGLSKFNEHRAAKELFDDFKELHPTKGLYACAYNGLLSSIPNLNSSVSTANEAVDNIVRHMEEHLVKPDLRVFNSILYCYRRFFSQETSTTALKLFNDMRRLNIEPSLFTYQNIIGIVNSTRDMKFEGCIGQFLDYIHANDSILSIRDKRDALFLDQLMVTFAVRSSNLSLANKLHKIYMKRPCLFEHAGRKQIYLDHYFRLIATTESMEDIWNFYTAYVPLNFRPSPETYDVLAEALDLYKADPSIVKKVAQHIVAFRLGDKIKNDAIFKKDPEYIKLVEESLMPRQERGRGRKS